MNKIDKRKKIKVIKCEYNVLCLTLCSSVQLCVSYLDFFCYTENHGEDTENHRDRQPQMNARKFQILNEQIPLRNSVLLCAALC